MTATPCARVSVPRSPRRLDAVPDVDYGDKRSTLPNDEFDNPWVNAVIRYALDVTP